MAGLNPLYVVAPALQQHFTDKDTANFLFNGYVLFWKDNARTIPKPVYQLVGSPNNYSYIEYGYIDTNTGAWRIDLNNQGAFDNIVYWYPYDEDGNVELYFVKVYSTDVSIIGAPSIEQFSVQAYPNVVQNNTPSGTKIDINYIPNSQFRLHNNLPANLPVYEANQVQKPITDIAYGGFTFERPNSSTARDFVIFERFGSYVTVPDGSPRYSVRIQCQQVSLGDTYKDLRIKFTDVNKFNSSDPDKLFTFSFYGQTNIGGSQQIEVLLYKYFGVGGSLPTTTNLATFNLSNIYQQYTVSFSFGDNSSSSIGTLNDDYLQLIVRMPGDNAFDVNYDDFILTDGKVTAPLYPDTPENEFKYQGIAGFMPVPDPNGYDLYLPLRLTAAGLEFDRSEIGKIYATSYYTPGKGELTCNGAQYDSTLYSSDGIPYARLGDVLFDTTLLYPYWGTGEDFVSTYPIDSDPTSFTFLLNKRGAITAPADGAIPTGFTFTNIYTAGTNHYAGGYWMQETSVKNYLFSWNDNVGAVTNGTDAGTSGFTVNNSLDNYADLRVRSGVQTIAATTLAGKWWGFDTYNSGNLSWYMWFTVDGAGTDPAPPGRTAIKVDLKSTDSDQQVARSGALAISDFQADRITCVAATSVTPGSYWTFETVSNQYYVWQTVDQVGTDPAIPNKIGIKVDLLSTDLAAQVVIKNVTAVNKRYYAVPQLEGLMLRGIDGEGFTDYDQGPRGSTNCIVGGGSIGAFEFDTNRGHVHNIRGPGATVSAPAPTIANNFANYDYTPTQQEGGLESRPLNVAVNYVIKY